ncbi:MAG TPA: DUF2779 domain-containing protein [Sphingobacteriaceae bacterium]|nr:DUF2779 domain-containing protein [Sphingobacteriaceae bacterium]
MSTKSFVCPATTAKIYLTKTRFQIGMECPTKLFYHLNPDKYPNQKLDDPFLEALAKGGFQVGALARAYYPGGILISEESNKAASEKTKELLKQENCVLFEAAIETGSFLIRVDILVKRGNSIELIEVKAKSFHTDSDSFLTAKGEISSGWRPYLTDVAFQQMVLRKAYPEATINCFLMLADKSKIATVDGLNQRFKVVHENGRTVVKAPEFLSADELGERILIRIPVNGEIAMLHEDEFQSGEDVYTLASFAESLASDLATNKKRYNGIGKHCNKCEFQTQDEKFLSGFHECWKDQTGLTAEQLKQPLLFELWRGNLGSKDIMGALLNRRDYFLKNFREDDYSPKTIRETEGFSPTDRRNLQVAKSSTADYSPAYDEDFLRDSFASFTYPLHFIDFETTALAIPMYRGRRPYEQIAFQFSHHQVEQDGSIRHQTQWLNDQVGVFPNFEFVRELKKALENDNGTIFRYHNHENTILNTILDQLQVSSERDRDDLCDFIRSITHYKTERTGSRDMVDLYQLVIKGFYHPAMKGSNSIKAVLPAMLECSGFLQGKYSVPCYGTREIPSLNFKDHTWLLKNPGGKWISPYKTLPPIFEGIDSEELDAFCVEDGEELADGGAAMMMYAKMQFTEMTPGERLRYHKALLRYLRIGYPGYGDDL